jgi:cytosine deaminase
MGDLVLRGGLVAGRRQDVAIRDGLIHRIGAGLPASGVETLDVTDKLVVPGFVESHIHPDKAFIADRTEGLSAGGPSAQTLVAELKKAFTVDDVYRRARRVLSWPSATAARRCAPTSRWTPTSSCAASRRCAGSRPSSRACSTSS